MSTSYSTIVKSRSTIISCAQLGKTNLQQYVRDHGKDLYTFDLDVDYYTPGKHVALIGGGMSSEREVSYMSCNGISRSLLELGYEVTFIDMGQDIASVLAHIKPDYVFNGLHGTYGEDGCLPGLLNIMAIPYTGCGVLASCIGFNKKTSLDIFKSNGIRIADSLVVKKEDGFTQDPMPRPYVIKPLSQGSSVGIKIVLDNSDFRFVDYRFEYGNILVEKYIKGREIQVAVLNGKALGTLEIKLLKGKLFYDYETKYTEGFAEHLCPAPLSDAIKKEALAISEKAAQLLGAGGMVRIEFIYDNEAEMLFLLEINTHPGMTPLSICPEIALKQHGITYTELVGLILGGAKFGLG